MRKSVYGPGIDEPICMIDATGQSEVMYYYHFDGLGSVIALSNENNEIVEKYSYDVYGEATILSPGDEPRTTSDVNNPYLFTGRRLDEETGLFHYRARYYSPEIGRFLQTDPVGYIAGLNLYSYVGNNPLKWTDPSGLCKEFGKGLGWGIAKGLAVIGLGIMGAVVAAAIAPAIVTALTAIALVLLTVGVLYSGTQVGLGIGGRDWNGMPLSARSRGKNTGFGTTIAAASFCSAAKLPKVGPTPENVAYRHVGSVEAKIVQSSRRVLNVYRTGDPKNVFYSATKYTSASAAEKALAISKPTHVITVDASNAAWNYAGNVVESIGIEIITIQRLPVINIAPLGPQ